MRPVPAVQPDVAGRARGRQPAPVPRPPASSSRASGEEAAAIVFASLEHGEGARFGVVGDSGTGKTHASRCLIEYYTRRAPGIVLVCDGKPGRSTFRGQQYAHPDELRARPPQPDPRVLVFRGDPWRRSPQNPEDVAAFSWELARLRVPSFLWVDELTDCAENGRWSAGERDSRVRETFAKGRSVGISVGWGSQSPQDAPRAAFEQSSVIVCFRLAGRGLAILEDRDYLLGGVRDVIPELPGDDVPPAERGVFVLLRRGRPWDGRFYRFG